MAARAIQVLVTSAERVVFEGTAHNLIFPGEQGTFEVLPLHRPLVSRLRPGAVIIDGRILPIRRGVVRVADDTVTAVVELTGER
jgi:F0F1-type ATP synthase epsilon subunit